MKPKHGENQAKANRLVNETSTYLLQHAYNPVDWYAWGAEALERSRKEDKPILLSIGYAACHWCHVMERESFENEETAKVMNDYFVNIKVDREERTDLDEIYMKAVQMMTGHGGWPMTVFLTPELKPFFGGTYFPPDDRHGLPGFKRLLNGVYQAWQTQRPEINESAEALTGHLRLMDEMIKAEENVEISYAPVELAVDKLLKIFDQQWGGFGSAPKFPHTFSLSLAMRYGSSSRTGDQSRQEQCLELVTTSLNRMAYGGIHDQIGGGFARYSVDRQWLVPHFEKMLYDNALLCQTYLDGYSLTGREYWARVARSILEFVLRELTTEEGAFYSSLDADSEGEEGKFYVFDQREIATALGSDAQWFSEVFGVTASGNFEHGKSVLHLAKAPEQLAEAAKLSLDQFWKKIDKLSEKLLSQREKRVRPGRDEKVLTSWNSLMISAFVEGYRVLREPKYLDAAVRATQFILTNLVANGKLLRTWGQGKAKLNGYVDDYSYFVQALLDLASVDVDPRWLDEAQKFTDLMLAQFLDEADGGLYYTGTDHEQLVTRPKSHYDGAIPSGSSVAIFDLIRLGKLTESELYQKRAQELLKLYVPYIAKAPDQFGNFICAIDFYKAKDLGIACIVPPEIKSGREEMIYTIYSRYFPNKVVLCGSGGDDHGKNPLLMGRGALEGKPTVYMCHNYSCDAPTNSAKELEERLARLMSDAS